MKRKWFYRSLICTCAVYIGLHSVHADFSRALEIYQTTTNATLAIDYWTRAADEGCVLSLLAVGDAHTVRGADDAAFASYLSALGTHPDTEYALRRIYHMPRRAERIDSVIDAFESLLDTQASPYIHTLTRALLARYYLSRSRFDDAMATACAAGIITNWMIIGGFENAERTGLRRRFGPEETLSLDAVFPGKKWDVEWRRAAPVNPDGSISFSLVQPSSWITVYLRTDIIAPTTTAVEVHLTCSGAFRVWMNGEPTGENSEYRSVAPLADRVPIVLHPGTNTLLVKVCLEDTTEDFSAYLTTPSGEPLHYPTLIGENSDGVRADAGQWPTTYGSPGLTRWHEKMIEESDLHARIMYARYVYETRRYTEAITLLTDIRNEGKAGAYDAFILGQSHAFKSAVSEAIASYRFAIERDAIAAAARAHVAQHYHRRGHYELAHPMADTVVEMAPNYILGHLVLCNIFRARRWNEDALRAANTACELAPGSPSAHLTRASVAQMEGYTDIREAAYGDALRSDHADISARIRRIRLYRTLLRFDEAKEDSALLRRLRPADPDVYALNISLYMVQRALPEAYAACREALDIFPDNADFYTTLGALYYMQEKRDDAIMAYHRALQFAPDNLSLRRYLEFLEGDITHFFAQHTWDEQQREELILAHMLIPPTSEEELLRTLLRQTLIHLNKDGSSRIQAHVIQKVQSPMAVRAASSVSIPGQLLKAFTWKSDGRVLEATHLSAGQLEFPDVQVGDTIEYSYRVDRYGGNWLDENYSAEYVFDQRHSSLLNVEVMIATYTNRPLRVNVHADDILFTREEDGEMAYYTWRAHDIPVYQQEPSELPFMDIARRVNVSTITNWLTVADWQRGLYSDIPRGNATARAHALEITEGITTVTGKVEAIFRYITENYRYTQMYTTRIAGVKPHTISDIIANRCGDCKDLSLLLMDMLSAVGIESYPVLMRTSDRGQLDAYVPTPNAFNHAIVYIPGIGEDGLFVDPTFRYGEYDLLPSPCQDVDVLIIDDDSYAIKRSPLAGAEDNREEMHIHAAMDATGTVSGHVHIAATRMNASQLRPTIERLPNVRNIGDYVLAQSFPGSELHEFVVTGEAPGPSPVHIDFTFYAPDALHPITQGFSFSLPFHHDAYRNMIPLETRKHPLRIASRMDNIMTYTLALPEIYAIEMPHATSDIRTDFGSFSFNATHDEEDNTLRVEARIIINQRDFSVEDYPAFRAFITSVVRVLSQNVRLIEHQ